LVLRPTYRKFGAIGPLGKAARTVNLEADGLGAARGQRFREGPCASHPTRQLCCLVLAPPGSVSCAKAPYGLDRASILVSLGTPFDTVGYRRTKAGLGWDRRLVKGLAYSRQLVYFALSVFALVPLSVRSAGLLGLHANTVQAFGRYVAKSEADNAQSLRQGPFLWVDALPDHEKAQAMADLKSGEVEMRRLSVNADGDNLTVPGGMIHDWEGVVFVPGAKLDNVLKILEDYNHHATYYAPDVEASRIESRSGDQFRVFMRFRRHKVVTVVLDTEHAVNYFRDSPLKAHSRSSATRIAQVDDPGGPKEKEKTPGQDDGYLWRMETWWRMEERDGGVYVQNQVITLTRDVPTGLGWLIEPFITNIPKETLEFTLQATRKAVLSDLKN
jgi:hypothetical protein